jgi:hypothetical protein
MGLARVGANSSIQASTHGADATTLTGGFFFGLRQFATVFFRLFRIPRLFPSHVAGIEMVLAIRIFTRLLLIGVFVVVVGHQAPSFEDSNNI